MKTKLTSWVTAIQQKVDRLLVGATDDQRAAVERRLFLKYSMALSASGLAVPARKHIVMPSPKTIGVNVLGLHWIYSDGPGASGWAIIDAEWAK